jgi:hypothetical protein
MKSIINNEQLEQLHTHTHTHTHTHININFRILQSIYLILLLFVQLEQIFNDPFAFFKRRRSGLLVVVNFDFDTQRLDAVYVFECDGFISISVIV